MKKFAAEDAEDAEGIGWCHGVTLEFLSSFEVACRKLPSISVSFDGEAGIEKLAAKDAKDAEGFGLCYGETLRFLLGFEVACRKLLSIFGGSERVAVMKFAAKDAKDAEGFGLCYGETLRFLLGFEVACRKLLSIFGGSERVAVMKFAAKDAKDAKGYGLCDPIHQPVFEVDMCKAIVLFAPKGSIEEKYIKSQFRTDPSSPRPLRLMLLPLLLMVLTLVLAGYSLVKRRGLRSRGRVCRARGAGVQTVATLFRRSVLPVPV